MRVLIAIPALNEAATLGEHNGEVVTELLGHSEEELETLRKDGVLIEKKEC